MSKSAKGFYVSLDTDVSEECAERFREAILMMKCVEACEVVEVDHDEWMNRDRIRREYQKTLFEVFKGE